MMRGSVVVMGTHNKQPYFSLKQENTIDLSWKKREDKAGEYSENYRKLLEIVEEMIIINMDLLKEKICL